MITLPASGERIALRDPDGSDEMFMHGCRLPAPEAALALLQRLGGDMTDWRGLVVTDVEHALLCLRVEQFGPRMALQFSCPQCRDRAEARFSVPELQASVTPTMPASVNRDEARPGWYRAGEAGFRLPTAGDQAHAAKCLQPVRALADLCLDETARSRPHRARVERLMAVMAPCLSRPIEAACPACGAQFFASLSVAHVVVAEFSRAAAGVHDEVDLIARAYHWPESAILALPQARRRAYAERIRRADARAA